MLHYIRPSYWSYIFFPPKGIQQHGKLLSSALTPYCCCFFSLFIYLQILCTLLFFSVLLLFIQTDVRIHIYWPRRSSTGALGVRSCSRASSQQLLREGRALFIHFTRHNFPRWFTSHSYIHVVPSHKSALTSRIRQHPCYSLPCKCAHHWCLHDTLCHNG